jgi:hypothetical protein
MKSKVGFCTIKMMLTKKFVSLLIVMLLQLALVSAYKRKENSQA